MLKSVYGEECLSRTSVFEWRKRFKAGRESLQDDERKGRPSASRTEESTDDIQKCLAEDRIFSVRMLEEMRGINRETVRKILVDDLKTKKVCARSVPHLLRTSSKSSIFFKFGLNHECNVLRATILYSYFYYFIASKSKLCYDRRSVGQSILVSSTHLVLTTRFLLLSDSLGLLMWRALYNEGTGLSFTITVGLRQRSHSRVRVSWKLRPYFTVSDSRLHFSSPLTTCRATVEVFEPASTREIKSTLTIQPN
jgi:hypothetical protein